MTLATGESPGVLLFSSACPPLCPQGSVSSVQLWVSGILAILRVLISQSTEDIVLSRIQELSFSPHLVSCPTISRLRDGDSTSALEEHSEGRQTKNLPEETFARYAPHLVCGLRLSCGVVRETDTVG